MKKIKYFLFAIITFLILKPNVFAASLSIWGSASNITVGNTVTISVNVKDMGGSFNLTSSDNSILSGGMSGQWLESDTYTFKFTAKKVGKATITITPVDVATNDPEPVVYTTSKSVTLNVVAKQSTSQNNSGSSSSNNNTGTTAEKKEYSTDNTLKSLTIDGHELTPKFSKDTTEYKLTVDDSVEKIKINATANHQKASVSGTGEKNLSSGENTIEIKVTAENGNEKKYKIIVTVEDQNPIKIKLNEEYYTIVKKNNELIEPLEHYEEITTKIGEDEIVAYENPKTNITLVLLKDKDNNINYYIYDKYKNTYTKYRYIKVGNITLQLLDSVEEPKNYKKYELELQDQKIDYYKIKGSHKVGLIYGTNIKTGNTGYYIYDKNEETLSKYYNEEIKVYQEKNQQLKNYLMISIGIFAFTTIIALIVSITKSKNKRKNRYKF